MNKQIEELKKDISYELGISYEEERLPFSLKTRDYLAKALIEKGYQKVDKDSVVLTRKEWKNLHEEKNDYKQRFESSEKRYEQLVQSSCEALEKKSKETAREILHKIYEQLSKYEAVNEIDYDCWVDDVLYEITKQYGVNLGEEQ